MTVPSEHAAAIGRFPTVLKELIIAELAAGNSIVDIGAGHPAPPHGSRLMLSKPLCSRPRASDERITFVDRNNSMCAAQITDAEHLFFILEAPLPQPPVQDMDAIRAEQATTERASNARRLDH